MTLEEVTEALERLFWERCDCVLSIRAGSTCNRCKSIRFYEELKKDLEK
jgi:hypothetical protein